MLPYMLAGDINEKKVFVILQGWHLCDEKHPLAFRNHEQLETYLNTAAPYLYRIYSILRQSPIKLNCFTGGKNGKGEAFQSWIRSVSGLP